MSKLMLSWLKNVHITVDSVDGTLGTPRVYLPEDMLCYTRFHISEKKKKTKTNKTKVILSLKRDQPYGQNAKLDLKDTIFEPIMK